MVVLRFLFRSFTPTFSLYKAVLKTKQNLAVTFHRECSSCPAVCSLGRWNPFPYPLATSPSFFSNTALAPNSIYSPASSAPLSDGQLPPHFSEDTACIHDLTLQLKPVILLRQSAATTHHNPLTSDSCNVLTTLGRPPVSSAVTRGVSFPPFVQRKLKCVAEAAV